MSQIGSYFCCSKEKRTVEQRKWQITLMKRRFVQTGLSTSYLVPVIWRFKSPPRLLSLLNSALHFPQVSIAPPQHDSIHNFPLSSSHWGTYVLPCFFRWLSLLNASYKYTISTRQSNSAIFYHRSDWLADSRSLTLVHNGFSPLTDFPCCQHQTAALLYPGRRPPSSDLCFLRLRKAASFDCPHLPSRALLHPPLLISFTVLSCLRPELRN